MNWFITNLRGRRLNTIGFFLKETCFKKMFAISKAADLNKPEPFPSVRLP
jgi:hypothetical protein